MIRTNNKAALYARFSSDNQRSESIDAQIRAMTEYCGQHNITIVETYIDEAKSATTDRRPSFQQMIADSNLHTFNILLVHKLDRFARNRYDSAVYKRELKKNGVTVYSVLENLDDSPESIMMESVLEGMSEYYSQNLAREVMKGMKETALQCKHTGGKPPLGYDVDSVTRKLVINESEAEIVRIIFEMYSEGYGYSKILEVLNEKGCKTKCGKDFLKNSLYSILTNPKYQGVYVFNRSSAKSAEGTRNTHLLKDCSEIIVIDGGCPQIVDTDIYKTVQKRIEGNKHKGGRNNAKTNYLLSGKVFCKECGRAMTGNTRHSGRNKNLYVTYRCPSHSSKCTNKEINKEYLERYVTNLLERNIFNVISLKRISKRIHEATEKQSDMILMEELAARDKISEIDEAINNITEAIMTGVKSDTLVFKIEELEKEKIQYQTLLVKLKAGDDKEIKIDSTMILQEYSTLKSRSGLPEYKKFVQGFIERIDVGRYSLAITLKTGLDIYPLMDTMFLATRQEIYQGSP